MKIANDVFMLSGVQHGTNSNTYAVCLSDQILLFDAGCTDYQWQIMQKTLCFWDIVSLPIAHTFITHTHFDHAGNCRLLHEIGSKIYAGPNDAKAIETGDKRTIDHLFKREFAACPVERELKDKEVISYGEITVTALHMPGHSAGSMMFLVHTSKNKLLVTGDFIALHPSGPVDDVEIALAWTGGPDYSELDYLESLKKACSLDVDILLPGHGPVYYGDCKQIFCRAYAKACKEFANANSIT